MSAPAPVDTYVRKVVEQAPPLTGAQRVKLAAILSGSADKAGAA